MTLPSASSVPTVSRSLECRSGTCTKYAQYPLEQVSPLVCSAILAVESSQGLRAAGLAGGVCNSSSGGVAHV